MEIQDRAAKMTVRILLDQDSDQTIFDDGTTVIKTCAATHWSARAVHFLDLIMLVCFWSGGGQLFVGKVIRIVEVWKLKSMKIYENWNPWKSTTTEIHENLWKLKSMKIFESWNPWHPKSPKKSIKNNFGSRTSQKRNFEIQEPMKFQEVLFVIMNQKILEVNQEIQ
mgnify:CR=1 FL=1